ncbi:unnamed protein product [Spodoptera exigua]|nr:unnamed protein product [Spodoptera exigua]
MHTLNVLLLAAAAACAVPRPLGPSAAPALSQLPHRIGWQPRPFRSDYILPRMLLPNPLLRYEENPRDVAPTEQDWLSKEIDRINQMDDDEELNPFVEEFSRWMARDPYVPLKYGQEAARESAEPAYIPETITLAPEEIRPMPPPREIVSPEPISAPQVDVENHKSSTLAPSETGNEQNKKTFALTPLDKEYYEPEDKIVTQKSDGPHEGGESPTPQAMSLVAFQPLRQIRQNPNLGRTKNLVAENLDRLRAGLTQENPDGTDKPRHIHVLESASDPADSIYGIALIAAVGTALTMAIIGFAFGWYTNGCEHRNGSVSDPESEEENEEGDYTVYECPGFATTGEMEVKNPLFSEDPTPATPGKCEIVKPQPKD